MSKAGAIWFYVYHYTESSFNYLNGVYYPDGTFLLTEVSYMGTADYPDSQSIMWNSMRTVDDCLTSFAYHSSYPTAVMRNWEANYLGTINNLQTAITKTAAQTMKIVYTLTDINDPSEDDGNG
jgi:hypothetical protein